MNLTMTETIRTIASLSNENQRSFYEGLKAEGFTAKEIEAIQTNVFFHKLFEDRAFYKAVESSLCETIYKELREKA